MCSHTQTLGAVKINLRYNSAQKNKLTKHGSKIKTYISNKKQAKKAHFAR